MGEKNNSAKNPTNQKKKRCYMYVLCFEYSVVIAAFIKLGLFVELA